MELGFQASIHIKTYLINCIVYLCHKMLSLVAMFGCDYHKH